MSSNVTSPQDAREATALEELASRLDRTAYVVSLVATAGRHPHLCISNRHAAQLTEWIYCDGQFFYWSWAERIAPVADLASAAAVISGVLRSVGDRP